MILEVSSNLNDSMILKAGAAALPELLLEPREADPFFFLLQYDRYGSLGLAWVSTSGTWSLLHHLDHRHPYLQDPLGRVSKTSSLLGRSYWYIATDSLCLSFP